jgi:hypothetical protein
MSLTQAAAGGDQRATLEALRNRLAADIDDCDSKRDLAALSKQMVDVLAAIAELPEGRETSAADEIAARRAARRPAPKRPARAQRPS